jgi:cytochrome-b5 reductase
LQAADNNKDIAEFYLLFANRSSADILLKEELENFVKNKIFSFKVFFTIDQAEDNWKGGVGFINKDMIVANLPEPADDTIILMCGPPVMCQKIVTPILTEIGHKKEDIFEF